MSYIDVTGKTEDEALRKGLTTTIIYKDRVEVYLWHEKQYVCPI